MASRIFAVDLGAWSVKLVVASPGLRGAALTQVAERLVPPGDEPVEVRAKAVLAQMVAELRLREEPGYLGVYGDQVFTQVLEFGFKNLRRAELDKAVGGELEGVVPVDLEDMVYAFEPIPNAPPTAAAALDPAFTGLQGETHGRVAPPADGMRVLTYAMRRDRAEALIGMARECGFEARGIVACGGGAAKLVERVPSLAQARQAGAVAVIDIGHERTDVMVVVQGKAVFSRSIARAGKRVTEAIRREWKNLSFEDAERAKHGDGFIASTAMPAAGEAWAKISNAIAIELSPFARDLRQTLAACRAKTGFTPSAAILVGGGSRLRGIDHYLAEQLGIAAWRLGADDMAAVAGPKIGAQAAGMPIDTAAMTIGIAYDSAGGRPQFDLRSGALAVKVDLSFLRAKAVPLVASVLTICAFAGIAAYADLWALKKADKTLQNRVATESSEHFGVAKSVDEILGEHDATVAASTSAALSPMPKMSAYDVLLEVSNHLPPRDKVTVDVDRLDIDDTKVYLEGLAKTPEEIDSIVSELKKVECFKDVQRGSTDAEGERKRFRLTITATCM
jgi:general secretion pathway protein L